MRKFHKEILENTMKNFMMIEKGYIILWKKLRFLAKHNNKPEFTYQNLKNFYECLTSWYFDMNDEGYGIHMSREA